VSKHPVEAPELLKQYPYAGTARFQRVYWRNAAMPDPSSKPAISIRDFEGFDGLNQVEAVEREVWGVSGRDTIPLTLAIATKAAGNLWLGAFDGAKLVGYAFGFFGAEHGRLIVHSHQLAVLPAYRDSDLGYRLKLAQRERVLALRLENREALEFRVQDSRLASLRVEEMTWTFDPLQSKNAHLNFAKLAVVSDSYNIDFYGPQTSSALHRNSTDRLWVRWPVASRRVQSRLQAKDNRAEMLDALSTLAPLIRFNGEGKPARTDLATALARQRIAIEIPSDIASIEHTDAGLAQEWRQATRWAFTESLRSGFFVAEFCRTVRGHQGPGVYLLEKGNLEEYVPELARGR
jgi:predicted GNAT superfamily acetyltransferase